MIESDWDLLCNITDELMATGRYPGRHEAMKEAQRQNPHLDPTPPGLKPRTSTVRTVTGNAEQQLNAMAKQIAAAKNITFSQAYVQAMTENPHLYRAYLEQHSRQTGGSRG
ncbi:MAG: hypothetical protein A4E73_00723 [Syntrophaceae bacterium PtaU1.Bin231]|nr:MAG: hypothetical protein A4E73_00723 [Syntrophaceae bacterium PtaU1.Bin231]